MSVSVPSLDIKLDSSMTRPQKNEAAAHTIENAIRDSRSRNLVLSVCYISVYLPIYF